MLALTYGMNQIVTTSGSLGIGDVKNESKVRFVIEGAGVGNLITIRGRIVGQSDWDTLTTLSGNAKQKVDVFTYDEIEVFVTTFNPVAVAIKVIATSFNDAGGSTTTIDAPSGGTIEGSEITFTSSDNSVEITSDPLTNTIDFKSVGAVGGTKYVKTVTLLDWTGPSLGEYTLLIPFSFHNKSNPVVTCMEQNGIDFDVVEAPVILTNNDVRIVVLESPDTRFVGKIFID